VNPELPFIIFGSLGMASIAGWLLRPLIVSFGRRLEGGAAPQLQAEVEAMRREHVQELEAVQQRLAEVEDRLDFAERLLAQPGEPARLDGGVR